MTVISIVLCTGPLSHAEPTFIDDEAGYEGMFFDDGEEDNEWKDSDEEDQTFGRQDEDEEDSSDGDWRPSEPAMPFTRSTPTG